MKRNRLNHVVIVISISCMILLLYWLTTQMLSHDGYNSKYPVSSAPPSSSSGVVTTPSPSLPPNRQLLLKNRGPYVSQLTGIGQVQPIQNRPIAVMVNNHNKAYPQSGLQQADIVYEVLAEGDITRYVAIYQSNQPQIIGPVRSIRPYYVELGDALGAVLVHAGWSQDAMNLIAQQQIAHLDGVYEDGNYFWRSTNRQAPHNLYTSIGNILEGMAKHAYSMKWAPRSYVFADEDTSTGELHAQGPIRIPYRTGYSVAYEYDTTYEVYNRYRNDQPHLDDETNEQLSAANVLIVESKHQIMDKDGRRDIDVYGPGQGVLLQQGRWQSIEWQLKDGLIRAYVNQQEVNMMRGVTWVQFVPIGTLAKIER